MAGPALSRIEAQDFGPFASVSVPLNSGLNVLIGDNSTGKTQLLKVLYCCAHAAAVSQQPEDLPRTIAAKLAASFRPGYGPHQAVGGLVRKAQGVKQAQVRAEWASVALEYSFSSRAKVKVEVHEHPSAGHPAPGAAIPLPVYMPSSDVLSLHQGCIEAEGCVDAAVLDTWKRLHAPEATALSRHQEHTLAMVREHINGTVREDAHGGFMLARRKAGTLEATLLAEGVARLATFERLLSRGVFDGGGCLLWDCPEAALNPRQQRVAAALIAALANQGTQVFIATHSMFLLRELNMAQLNTPETYIGLRRTSRDASKSYVDDVQSTAPVAAEVSDELLTLRRLAVLEAEEAQVAAYLGGAGRG